MKKIQISAVENALPKESDLNYVRGLDANGNSILINKNDFSNVLGKLLGISNFLKSKSYANKTSDMNTLKQGIYMYSPEAGYPKNFPEAFGRGTIEVMSIDVHIIQKVYDFNESKVAVYARLSYNSGKNWYRWMTL